MQFHKEINDIKFSVASTEDIRNKSVYEVKYYKFNDNKDNTIYDSRAGALFGKKCKTCRQYDNYCPGHFGHIELNTPVIHPIFFSHVLSLLKVICHSCCRLLISRRHLEIQNTKLEGEKLFNEIQKRIKKFTSCFHCNTMKRKYAVKSDPLYNIITADDEIITDSEIKDIFDDIDEETLSILGISHPRNFILEVFPVIPPCCRPYEIICNNLKEDDLTKQLLEIIKANNMIKEGYQGEKKKTEEELIHNLKFAIESFCRNPKKKPKTSNNNEALVGIRERLTGKSGQMRDNLMGKRTEMSSRTVIGPDPSLKVDEVGVPEEIAKNTAFPEIVYPSNIERLKELIVKEKIEKIKRNGNVIRIEIQMYKEAIKFLEIGDVVKSKDGKEFVVKDKRITFQEGDLIFRDGKDITPEQLPKVLPPHLEIGDAVMRRIKNGDWVLMNRQPTLWKGSMMGFKVRIHKHKTFTFNLAVCKAFNSDFDGDEQNGHFPQSIEAMVELLTLSSPKECILGSTNGAPVICILQDALLGSYLITSDNDFIIPREDYNDLLMGLTNPASHYIKRRREIIQTLKDLNIFKDLSCLRKGKNVLSLIFKKDFDYKDDDLEIVQGVIIRGRLNKDYLGSSKKSLINHIMTEFGRDDCMEFLNDIQFIINKWLCHRSFSINLADFKSTHDIKDIINQKLEEATYLEKTILNDKLREFKIKECLSNARDTGMTLVKRDVDNNMITTIKAGSKGDAFNLGQVEVMLGQQIINGQRIDLNLDNGTRSLIHYNRDESKLTDRERYEARGFIMGNFYDGLNVDEFFLHSMSGRQGVCDTAMSTFMAGYNMRKLIKLTEDIKIQDDRVVADSLGNVYDFSYGRYGFNPENGLPNISKIVNKIIT